MSNAENTIRSCFERDFTDKTMVSQAPSYMALQIPTGLCLTPSPDL